jgi:hypothetical protein
MLEHVALLLLLLLLLLLQGGLAVNTTGSYRPALRITGMTPGLQLHLDDFEVCYICKATLLYSALQ